MGTRGFVGFVVDGKEAITYNHCDSYPGWLGVNTLNWLRSIAKHGDFASAAEQARRVRLVTEAVPPTDEEIAALKRYYNPSVGGRSERPTWYQLLREAQGYLGELIEAGFMEDGRTFPLDSLWAEWGYIVDFDAGVLEAYRGFQHEAHADGRFARPEPNDGGYFPCRLVASWPLSSLPEPDAFVAQLEDGDEEDEDEPESAPTADELRALIEDRQKRIAIYPNDDPYSVSRRHELQVEINEIQARLAEIGDA